MKYVNLSHDEFIHNLDKLIHDNLDAKIYYHKKLSLKYWQILVDNGIFLPAIPKEYGGRESHKEMCDVIQTISKYNLPIGMYTMIVTVLFIRNIVKYGSTELKEELFIKLASEPIIGGFALTEPSCGSNLARMKTFYIEKEDGYHIEGEKHWQAFSLTGNWWIVAAREKDSIPKKFSYFVMKRSEGFENIEEYDALGLKPIDYGLNEINAFVPKYRKLEVNAEGLNGALEMLCASRLSMSAMASGSVGRVYKDALYRTKERSIGDKKLYDIGFVKFRLKTIRASKTLSDAIYQHLKNEENFYNNLLDSFFVSQCIKSLVTDKMLDSAMNYQQLCGGEGYRHNSSSNLAAYALLNNRIYTIFDGTNDLLYCQITDFILDKCRGFISIEDFLRNFEYTNIGIEYCNIDTELFNIENIVNQESKVLLGSIIARFFGINCIETFTDEEEKEDAINILIADIHKIQIDLQMVNNLQRKSLLI